jgi:hypothetical protein
VGYQYIAGQAVVKGVPTANYTDWKVGLTKDFGGGLSLAAAYIGTNAAKSGSTYAYSSPSGKNLGGSTGIVSLTKTF